MWHTVSIWAFSWKYDVFVQVKRKRRDDFLTKVETSLQLKASNSTYPKTRHQKLVRLTRVRLSYYETNFDSSEVKLVLQRRASGGELSSVRDTRVFDLCVFDSDEWDCIYIWKGCLDRTKTPSSGVNGNVNHDKKRQSKQSNRNKKIKRQNETKQSK